MRYRVILSACAAALLGYIVLAYAQPREAVPAYPAANGPTNVATRVMAPKRRADEAIGATNEPSVSGDWLTVRSSMPSQDAPGAVQIYRKRDAAWRHFQTLLSPDERPVDDGFGWATAIDANTMVIGAPDYEVDGVRSGVVLIYTFGGDRWALTATVKSPDPAANGYFGQHVALDRGTLVVGEARQATVGGGAPNRAVYVFRQGPGGTWPLQATIAVPKELSEMVLGRHGFGNHVEVDGDTIAIAARDQVYLYRRNGTNWQLEQRLDAPRDPQDSFGGPSFARSLGLDDDVLVVGALRAAGRVPDAGAAFVYRRQAGRWQQEAKLTASDGVTRDMFGHWVALDRGTIVSGAFRHAVDGHREAGAVYVYRKVNGIWTEVAKIVPSNSDQQLWTAYGVAINGATIVLSGGTKPDQTKSDYFWTFNLATVGP